MSVDEELVAPPLPSVGLVGSTMAELRDAGRLDTSLGWAAVELAQRIKDPRQSGAAVAALMREYRVTMVEAMKGAQLAATPLDELRVRRDRKLGS